MIHYKKKLTAAVIFVFLVICSIMIYRINTIFPNPKNISASQGKTVVYKGLNITIGELELYQEKQFYTTYPDIVSNLDLNYFGEDENVYNYIIANIKVQNMTKQDISLGKESILTWVVETGNTANAMSFSYFLAFNPDYNGSFFAGEEMELKLLFLIMDDYLSWERLKKSDVKIVYSYYPTKNYILYKSEEREL